jgi:hypothetical protein
MHVQSLLRITIAAGAMAALGACNKSPSSPLGTPAAGSGNAVAASSAASSPQTGGDDDDAPITHIACDKIFTPADTAALMKGNVTINVYPYRSNACEFSSDSGSTINLYSGNGDTEQLEWREASTNAQGRYKPLAGFGDQAFYRSDSTGSSDTQVKKGDYYCAVTGGGQRGSEAVAKGLAALCEKVFAAR